MSALAIITATGVVPVVVIDDPAGAPALGEALLGAGLPCLEITFRTRAALDAIRLLAEDPRLTVGAGTVLNPGQVDLAHSAGAQFVVSPGFDPAVVRRCQALGVSVIPGVATPTDAMAALREELDIVKLFPAVALGGLAMLDALAAPFPGLRFVPTGGIDLEALPSYLLHHAVAAVGGSWIAPRGLLREHRFDEVGRRAVDALAAVSTARQLKAART